MNFINKECVREILFPLACLLFACSLHAAENDAFPLITKRIQGWVDCGYYSGCSLWIARGDQVLYQKSFGSHSPETPVYIASAGKWLASAAMLAVVDDGKLSLDDMVVKILPEFRGDPKGMATLRQLFSHTSGYPPYQPDGRPVDNYQTLTESVEHLLPLPPVCKPGERFEYGGLAMQTGGRMVEKVEGKDWETVFQDKIAIPLGMKKTRFTPVDTKQGGHAPMLGGSAVSTLSDYSRFLTMIADGGLFNGRRILSEKALREMESDQAGNALVKREEFVERVRGATHHGIYGLGMWREEVDAQGNAVLMSSPGWAGTYAWIDRRNDIRGVFIAHVDVANAGKGNFSGFWTSPVLEKMVRAELEWNKPRQLPGYEEGIVHVKDGDLVYEAAGTGEPVVLLHGHSFDRRMWDLQFAELAESYRVIRYDLRGYGLSDLPSEGRPFLHAEDLSMLLDGLHIRKAHLIGLSLGGFVVIDFLALHPDRVLSAVIASGGIHRGPGSYTVSDAERPARLAEIEQTRLAGIAAFKQRWRDALLCKSTMVASQAELLTRMIDEWSAWQPLHIEPRLVLGPDALSMLKERKPAVPVLWLTGERDAAGQLNNEVAAVLPQMKMKIIPNAGHMSNLEQPGAFNSALLQFLNSTDR